MAQKVYKTMELVGTSKESIDGAIQGAIARATETVRNIDWFEVKEIRGAVVDNQLAEFQVKFEVGFRLDEAK